MSHLLRRCLHLLGCVGSLCGLASLAVVASRAAEPKDHLIVPGERIGGVKLDLDSYHEDKVPAELGEFAFGEGGMGKNYESWYVGVPEGDKGKPFRRPKDISIRTHRDEESRHWLTSNVAVTSPLYATAEGIKPGSTLAEVQSKFPGLRHGEDDHRIWPGFGTVDFYGDARRGVTFAVSSPGGTCLQIEVYARTSQPEEGRVEAALTPSATQDFGMNSYRDSLGADLPLGLSSEAALDLLGKPASETGLAFGGALWRWRLPFQKPNEEPALGIAFTKLPDGRLVANYLRASSPLFHSGDTIFPGCPLKNVLSGSALTHLLGSFENRQQGAFDLYGDFQGGQVMEVSRQNGTCTAICLVPRGLGTLLEASQAAR